MKHYIIVKFSDTVKEKEMLYSGIEMLLKRAEKIEGIHRVSFYPSVINQPNRYDFMILMEMEREALPIFDASDIHRNWKAEYGCLLSAKTIFDCD